MHGVLDFIYFYYPSTQSVHAGKPFHLFLGQTLATIKVCHTCRIPETFGPVSATRSP
jgi:hypothetical protein